MTISRGLGRFTALTLAALLSTACTGAPGPGPGPSPTASAPTSVDRSSAPPALTSSSAPPSSATSTTPTAPAAVAVARRSATSLKKALLAVDDLPSGWSVEPSSTNEGKRPSSSSTNPRCAALNRILNTDDLAGTQARATTAFSGGSDGPFVSERIDALGSVSAAGAVVSKITTSAKGCDAVTLRVPGQGSSKMRISQVSPPQVGGKPYALRLSASGGALDGLEVTFFWSPVGDVVLSLSLINAYPEEFDGIATDAHAKLTDVLKVSTSTT